MPWAFYHSFLLRKILSCYFNMSQSGLCEHTSLALLSQGPGGFEGCVSLLLCKWVSEPARGFLTHWDNSRAQEDKNSSAPHMGPFRPLHLRTHSAKNTRRKRAFTVWGLLRSLIMQRQKQDLSSTIPL